LKKKFLEIPVTKTEEELVAVGRVGFSGIIFWSDTLSDEELVKVLEEASKGGEVFVLVKKSLLVN
jgi:hypothetical protein